MVVLLRSRKGSRGVHTLLLVRNGVSHDARVLRAARVAQGTLGGGTLVVGVATAPAHAGRTSVEGVQVLRLSARARARRQRGHARATPLPHAEATSVPPAEATPRRPHPRNISRPTGGPARGLTWRARARRILSGVLFAWQALLVARRERPALVHANDWNTMWCGLTIKLTCGARLVYDSHELWADRHGRWEQRWWLLMSEALFVRLADEVLTASPGYADVLAKRYRIARPSVIRNIPHGPPATISQPQAPPLAVYVGGLMPGRGLEQTIDALALAPAIRLRAIGPGSPRYRASLLERAAALGIEDRVELACPVPPAMVAEVLACATAGLCLIQPVCRSYELTLPNKLFEYAAAGVPVLVSDLPVIAAVVRTEGLGEVVPCANPRGIAAGLERLVEAERWSEAARCSHAFAKANDWGGESRALALVYERALMREPVAQGPAGAAGSARVAAPVECRPAGESG
jgi:glycosyltransferase involved in cell wall biosynthesis